MLPASVCDPRSETGLICVNAGDESVGVSVERADDGPICVNAGDGSFCVSVERANDGPICGHAHVASLWVRVGLAGDRSAPRILARPQSMTSSEKSIGGAVDDAHAATVDLLAEGVAPGGGRLWHVATKARGVRVHATDGVCWVVGGSHLLPRDNA
ncbi:MAG: hypothetical protein ACLQVF_02090 [Isosphaeraceae bacterium]